MGLHHLAAAILEEQAPSPRLQPLRDRADDPPPCECSCPWRADCRHYCASFRRWLKTGQMQSPPEAEPRH